MRWGVASAMVIGVLVFAGIGFAAASFSDPVGDTNEAPDVTSVTVSESAAAIVTVSVAVRNYQSLPANSWINLWFDLDSNPATGAGGHEALVTYLSDGVLDFFHWNGSELARQSNLGMTAAYSGGVLTLSAPRTALDNATAFGILTVAAREQEVVEYIAADFAPDDGRSSPFVGPELISFSDPVGDQPAAPDVTSVRVSDAKNGSISFAVTTPNLQTLPPQTLVFLWIDSDGKLTTGGDGVDIMIVYGAGQIQMLRWSQSRRDFVDDDPPFRVQTRNSGGVLTIVVHRSELGNPTRFGFAVGAGHLGVDSLAAVDFAPESRFWQYKVVNKAALKLLAGTRTGAPVRPVAGKAFTISVPITRSDTGKKISTGTVACAVNVAGKRVAATGRVSSGSGRCAFRVPETASGKRVTGSMVVRSGGKTVTARFAFTVR